MKKKFVLEFDKIPALIFVSKDGINEELYIRGEKAFGWRGVKINSSIEDVTTYDVEFLAVNKRDEDVSDE